MENQTSRDHYQSCRDQHQCEGDKLTDRNRRAARWQGIHDLVAPYAALTPDQLTCVEGDQDDVEEHKAGEAGFDHDARNREHGVIKRFVCIPDVYREQHQAGDHDDFVRNALDDVAVGCTGDTCHRTDEGERGCLVNRQAGLDNWRVCCALCLAFG